MEKIGHTKEALEDVERRWSHSHGANPDGHVICVPCMATAILRHYTHHEADLARSGDGRLVMVDSSGHTDDIPF